MMILFHYSSSSKLVEDFTQEFPGKSLPVELSEFSFPTQLRDTHTALSHHGSTVCMTPFNRPQYNHIIQFNVIII